VLKKSRLAVNPVTFRARGRIGTGLFQHHHSHLFFPSPPNQTAPCRAITAAANPPITQIKIQTLSRFATPAFRATRLPGGIGHFITVLEERDGQYVIGDPMTGRQTISTYDHPLYLFTRFSSW